MPRVPGVPTLDPVNQPMMSPGEAGRPGEAIAQVGQAATDAAATGLQLDLYIKKAQEHVDSLAAQTDLARVYADVQNQLSKTQNSSDVAGVIEDGYKRLNEVSNRWSTSPAAVQIQMNADALRPDLSRIGTVRQVDLMGKELKITLNQQSELLAGNYAADRAAGGSGDAALGAFSTAVHGGVTTGLLGDVEAQEYVRLFRQKGQELQIRNGIANANPTVNQKTYDDIVQHRDQFPDVTQEQLDVMKGHALAAFEAHTKQQDWAEGEMALRTQLVPKITEFTNPATGRFDEAAALTDNANRLAKGEITETQSRVLAQGFTSHEAQLNVGLKQEAEKRLDDVEKYLSSHDFKTAFAKLEQNQPWFENNGFANDYRAALRYASQKKAEVRAENSSFRAESRYEHEYQRQVAQDQSQEQLAEVTRFINNGGLLSKADIYGMAGTGKGHMSTTDANKAWALMRNAESNPDFAAGLKYIDDSFKIPKDASADVAAAQNRKYAEISDLYQQEVNAHPDKSKLEIARDIVKSESAQRVKDHADRMFGRVTASSIESSIRNFFASPFTYGLKPGDVGYKEPPKDEIPKPATIVQHSPSTGKDRYSLDGGKTWIPGKPPQ